jgi:hypothetical protein
MIKDYKNLMCSKKIRLWYSNTSLRKPLQEESVNDNGRLQDDASRIGKIRDNFRTKIFCRKDLH